MALLKSLRHSQPAESIPSEQLQNCRQWGPSSFEGETLLGWGFPASSVEFFLVDNLAAS